MIRNRRVGWMERREVSQMLIDEYLIAAKALLDEVQRQQRSALDDLSTNSYVHLLRALADLSKAVGDFEALAAKGVPADQVAGRFIAACRCYEKGRVRLFGSEGGRDGVTLH